MIQVFFGSVEFIVQFFYFVFEVGLVLVVVFDDVFGGFVVCVCGIFEVVSIDCNCGQDKFQKFVWYVVFFWQFF